MEPWNPPVTGGVATLAATGAGVYAGGTFTRIGGARRANLALLDTRTGKPTAWAPDPNGPVRLVVPAGRSVYAAGDFRKAGGSARNGVAELDAATGRAKNWQPSLRKGEPLGVGTIVVTPAAVAIGGDFEAFGASAREGLGAIDIPSGRIGTWNPGRHGIDGLLHFFRFKRDKGYTKILE